MDNVKVINSGPEFYELVTNQYKIAQIVIATDGGPWAKHNYPCPVCWTKPAILDMNIGIFQPCGVCQQHGWQLVKWKKTRWARFTSWLRKV